MRDVGEHIRLALETLVEAGDEKEPLEDGVPGGLRAAARGMRGRFILGVDFRKGDVGLAEAAGHQVVAAVPELPAFLADQVARDRIREGNAAAQPDPRPLSERGGGVIRPARRWNGSRSTSRTHRHRKTCLTHDRASRTPERILFGPAPVLHGAV